MVIVWELVDRLSHMYFGGSCNYNMMKLWIEKQEISQLWPKILLAKVLEHCEAATFLLGASYAAVISLIKIIYDRSIIDLPQLQNIWKYGNQMSNYN